MRLLRAGSGHRCSAASRPFAMGRRCSWRAGATVGRRCPGLRRSAHGPGRLRRCSGPSTARPHAASNAGTCRDPESCGAIHLRVDRPPATHRRPLSGTGFGFPLQDTWRAPWPGVPSDRFVSQNFASAWSSRRRFGIRSGRGSPRCASNLCTTPWACHGQPAHEAQVGLDRRGGQLPRRLTYTMSRVCH